MNGNTCIPSEVNSYPKNTHLKAFGSSLDRSVLDMYKTHATKGLGRKGNNLEGEENNSIDDLKANT